MAHQQPQGSGAPLPGVNAGGAPQVVPLGRVPGPVAPQLLYAADPGTITGWLMKEAMDSTADSLSDEIEAVTQHYAILPAVGDAAYSEPRGDSQRWPGDR
eukprot:scaffold21179_cov47-Attheya_sp.AAC.5